MKRRHWLYSVFMVALLSGLLFAAPGAPKPVLATLGWVGNMDPAGGSNTTITVGGTFDVYVQVYKAGVTDSAGQGAGIACYLQWAAVPYWGGDWTNITHTLMTYNTDIGNNDEYKATISPAVGLYEFTAYCTDTTDNTTLYQGGGNGKLVVKASSGDCNTATPDDNNVYWSGLVHDSFSTAYRNPLGAVSTTAGTVTLKFRTCMNDLNVAPQVRIWQDRGNIESLVSMSFDSHGADASLGGVTYWKYDLPIPTTADIYYYVFKATNGSAVAFYRDDNPRFYGGGLGQAEGSQDTAYNNSYQLTIYDAAYTVPEWMQRAVIYQIFPDRFRDGDPTNNPTAGRFSYARSGGAIVRSNDAEDDWNTTVCDPRGTYTPACADYYGDNFYGGDLRGIIQKLEDGYFENLGVSVLYLNPIFLSPSNHKYDTADFMRIDPDFGTLADFQELTTKAAARGIRVMLDGVFNHTSSDSRYFDRYSRYNANGDLINPNGGADDNSGACESPASTYRGWFYIPDTLGSPGSGANDRCDASDADDNDTPPGAWTLTYTAWWGYGSLPKLQATSSAVRDLFFAQGLNSVGPYWTQQGASAWRFDVGDDVDAGLNAPDNTFWESFRTAVRDQSVTGKSDVVMLGEIWGDASPWLLGNEWDSVMNYRFRSTLLDWLFTGCSGNGCTNGTKFSDNDSNDSSSSGPIEYISPSQFNARLRSLQEDYPPMAWKAMMNLEGSHDTNRVRFLLKKINNDNDSAAVQRMKEWWLFSFTYAGAPTLYYGDEIGLNHDGVWASNKWEDDPYNRAPFPWDDATGNSYSYDATAAAAELQQFARTMASIRWSYRALQDGDVQHGLVIDDVRKLYGFARTNGEQTALIVLNRSGDTHSVTLSGLNAAPYNLADGVVLIDALHGNATYTVSGGAVTVPVAPTYGVVLLEQAKVETPMAPAGLSVTPDNGHFILTWNAVTQDAAGGREVAPAYTVHRDTTPTFTANADNRIATVYAPTYGTIGNTVTYTDTAPGLRADPYYIVCTTTGAWYEPMKSACSDPLPTSIFLASFAAIPQSQGIRITWETAMELRNWGFNLYRGDAFSGPWTRLNAELIPPQNPGATFGATYEWLDADVTPGATYFYRLEDVDLNGTSTFHGPVSATATEAAAVTSVAFKAQRTGGMEIAFALVGVLILMNLRRRRPLS